MKSRLTQAEELQSQDDKPTPGERLNTGIAWGFSITFAVVMLLRVAGVF